MLQFKVVTDDEVDQSGERCAGQQELSDRNPSKDRRKHYTATHYQHVQIYRSHLIIVKFVKRHTRSYRGAFNPLTPTVGSCHMGTAVKHHVRDRVKPSFVIFDIRAL